MPAAAAGAQPEGQRLAAGSTGARQGMGAPGLVLHAGLGHECPGAQAAVPGALQHREGQLCWSNGDW